MKNNIISFVTINIIVLLISFSFCSCNESYINPDYITPDDTIHHEVIKDYIPIMLSMSDPYYTTVTKGYGPIVSGAPWVKENAIFYIYSFLTNNYAYKGNIDYTAPFSLEEDLPKESIMQCLIDDPKTGLGAPTILTDDDILDFVDTDAEYYYSLRHQDYKYNFFAYYIDDAVIIDNIAKREKDRVYLDINVDGTQDIVTGVAKLKDVQLENIDHEYDKWLYANVLNGELVYSAMTGHRFIFPIFEAQHHMARLMFNLRGEDKMSDRIYVQDVYVKAHRDWRLTVAADNIKNIGLVMNGKETLKELHLCDSISGNDGTKPSLKTNYYSVGENDEIQNLGIGMLLPPRESYDVFIKCAYEKNGVWRTYTAKYALKYRREDKDGNMVSEGFKAGGVYNVTMHVYGYEPIKLSIDGLDWGTPVEIEVDEENTDVEFTDE